MGDYARHQSGPLPDDAPGPFPAGDPEPLPSRMVDPDPEWAEYIAWEDREIAAGRYPQPEPSADPEAWAPDAPAPADQDLQASAAPHPRTPAAPHLQAPADRRTEVRGNRQAESCAGGTAWSRFAQGNEADELPPGQLLVGLTEGAVRELGRLSDDELIGVLRATRRQIAREQYKQVLVTAEFGRRRQDAFQDAASRGVPVGCRPGGFPGEELAVELVAAPVETGHRIDDAMDLTSRLPMTLAGMATGQIDEDRAGWIALYTRSMTPADAARADEILAEAAPDLRVEQVARKAAALEKKFAPDAVKARREHTKRNEQRVEARRELSGNASLSGREMDTADVIAAKAYIDAIAARLRDGGLSGPIGTLRVLALADLTQGRNPLDRLGQRGLPFDPLSTPPDPADTPDNSAPHGPGSAASRPPGSAASASPSPLPAGINLIVPVGTLLGFSADPAQAGSWGLLDRDETRAVVGTAARHPRTRWCVTLTAPDGTALAHGCARGRYPRLLDDLDPQPPPAQVTELLRRLNLAFTPVAQASCDHTQAEERYVPSRALRHLVRARSAGCDAPGCQAPAISADLDHTTPWPDGPTDQCNLAPRCRTHHRAKQAPDWKVEQVQPGVTRWTLPSGRTHLTSPTRYES